jgi:hypothetical protein
MKGILNFNKIKVATWFLSLFEKLNHPNVRFKKMKASNTEITNIKMKRRYNFNGYIKIMLCLVLIGQIKQDFKFTKVQIMQVESFYAKLTSISKTELVIKPYYYFWSVVGTKRAKEKTLYYKEPNFMDNLIKFYFKLCDFTNYFHYFIKITAFHEKSQKCRPCIVFIENFWSIK